MDPVGVQGIREHFVFPERGRIVTSHAPTTQPPRVCSRCPVSGPGHENVRRGQSTAWQLVTATFEESYDTIARFPGAPGRASIALSATPPRRSARSCTRC